MKYQKALGDPATKSGNILKVSLIEAMLKTKSYLYYYTQEKSVNNSYLNDHENIRGGLYYAKSDI